MFRDEEITFRRISDNGRVSAFFIDAKASKDHEMGSLALKLLQENAFKSIIWSRRIFFFDYFTSISSGWEGKPETAPQSSVARSVTFMQIISCLCSPESNHPAHESLIKIALQQSTAIVVAERKLVGEWRCRHADLSPRFVCHQHRRLVAVKAKNLIAFFLNEDGKQRLKSSVWIKDCAED